MASRCFAPVRGRTVRVTEIDSCGVILPAARQVTSDGFVTISVTAEIEDGDEVIVKKSNGSICVSEKAPDSLKRLTVAVDWCEVDPELFAMITGFPVVDDGAGEAVGWRWQKGEMDQSYALEIWTGISGEKCGPSGAACYNYLLFPLVSGGSLGDFEISAESTTFSTTGNAEAGSQWGVGPYAVIGDDVAGATTLDEPIGPDDIAHTQITCVPPPDPACGAVALSVS